MKNKNRTQRIVFFATAILVLIALFLFGGGEFASVRESIRLMMSKPEMEQVFFEQDELKTVHVDDLTDPLADIVLCDTMVLVNQEYPVLSDAAFSLSHYKQTDVLMNVSMLDDYAALSASVTEQTGDKLYVMSSFRSFEEQQTLYDEDPSIAAMPGQSEHHTGLALDVYVYMYAGGGFINSAAGKYVQKHCNEYGFIIRYPNGKENITGYSFEPWHIRYVGKPHATFMYLSGLVLEEYLELFEIGSFYTFDGYIISRQLGDALQIPKALTDVIVSPDNTGSYIISGHWTDPV